MFVRIVLCPNAAAIEHCQRGQTSSRSEVNIRGQSSFEPPWRPSLEFNSRHELYQRHQVNERNWKREPVLPQRPAIHDLKCCIFKHDLALIQRDERACFSRYAYGILQMVVMIHDAKDRRFEEYSIALAEKFCPRSQEAVLMYGQTEFGSTSH